MVQGVGLNDVIQLPEAKTEELVQALAFQAADPRFDEAICLCRRLHPMRAIRRERFASPIPFILAAIGICHW